ncbi:ArsR family transcriptional regulator [Megasphaera cerevisiae DSM 20462]|jgi:two-component system alkaline phosphatase synthesis response regulator PhoP|uniref:ArsR family transcriptional regulator n=1 Tax=Megasphaera cerevisiae DSM 20462 TaxID=1122219 RepID=A0A0J6WTR3_9FIRM|nr:response regulator transcription factor [Megasphaera cerevisiae]KMO85543.1 ArsR family transcriptional regulator [Megasphaera cerevisiae DSM 20462]OKY52897.1 DNA-binding response regulator [Megasphaera cerevisiae]SJZ74850.1 two-component system, OmpR family, alkaline phosphatase synthesis response regulator PhoP [Megasphaera cerevisiae DSM 20462]
MALIYCVEDDENIRELVGYALRSQNFEVETFADGKEFWKALQIQAPSLVLLDIMLPGENGTEILDKIRKDSQYRGLPVIMLTAKTSEYDIVKGLDNGADDYMCKPFGIVELISRIRAVLRRSKPQSTEKNIFSFGPVALDAEKHIVTVSGDVCHLTVKEFELLRYLLVNIDIVLKREQIMEAVWGFSYEGESRTIDMHIKSLRQKLGEGGHIIRTVRGVGYVIGGNI